MRLVEWMVYRELVDYINNTRLKGYSDDLISRGLVAKGWAKHDIAAAYELVNQEKFKPLEGEAAKTKQEIVEEKKVAEQEEKIISHGFSSSAAWIRCVSAPKLALSNARYFASYVRALKSIAGAYFIEALVFLIIFSFGSAQLIEKLPAAISGPLLSLSVPFVVGLTLAGIASWVLQAILLNFLAWLPARFLFNGQGSFSQQLYCSSIAFGGGFVLFSASLFLAMASTFLATPSIPPFYLGGYAIPVFTLAAGILSAIMLLYAFYLHVCAVKVAHQISSTKALLAILIGVAVAAFVVSFALKAVFGALDESALGSMGFPNNALASLVNSSGISSAAQAGAQTISPTPVLP